MTATPYPNPVEPDGITPVPRTPPYDVSSFINPIYGKPLRKVGLGYGDSQYGNPIPMHLRRSLGKSKPTVDIYGRVVNVTHQKRVFDAGQQFDKNKEQSAGGLSQKLKRIDWDNPYNTQDVSQGGQVFCPSGIDELPKHLYAELFKSNRGRSFDSGLDSSGSQDCISVSACGDALSVSAETPLPVFFPNENIIGVVNPNTSSVLSVSSNDIIVSNLDEISSISVNNFPVVQQVSGALSFDTSATLTVSGSVGVSNLAEVSSVKVNNLSEVSSLAVNNFPSTQAVSGSIGVSNLAEVSSVGVNNFPTGFVASGTVLDNIETKLGEIDTAVDTIDGVVDSIKSNSDSSVANLANVLTLKRQVVNATPAGLEIQTGSGGLTVSSVYSPENATLSSVLLDLDTAGGSPATDTVLVSAQGSGTRISIYGWNISMTGTTAGTLGNWVITNGAVSSAKYLAGGMVTSNVPTHQCKDLTLPLACDENTDLKFTSTESSGNIYVYGTIQYRIEAV
jgi:hypothetical protein